MKRFDRLGDITEASTPFAAAAVGATILGICVAAGRTEPIKTDPATVERVAEFELRNPNEPFTCLDDTTLQLDAAGNQLTVQSPRCNQR